MVQLLNIKLIVMRTVCILKHVCMKCMLNSYKVINYINIFVRVIIQIRALYHKLFPDIISLPSVEARD